MSDERITTWVAVGIDGRPIDPPSRPRTTGVKVAFHLIGASLMVCTYIVTSFVGGFIGWINSTCNGDATDPSAVQVLRLELLAVVLAASLAPTAWTLVAWHSRHAWRAWCGFTIAVVVLGVTATLRIDRLTEWCVF